MGTMGGDAEKGQACACKTHRPSAAHGTLDHPGGDGPAERHPSVIVVTPAETVLPCVDRAGAVAARAELDVDEEVGVLLELVRRGGLLPREHVVAVARH